MFIEYDSQFGHLEIVVPETEIGVSTPSRAYKEHNWYDGYVKQGICQQITEWAERDNEKILRAIFYVIDLEIPFPTHTVNYSKEEIIDCIYNGHYRIHLGLPQSAWYDEVQIINFTLVLHPLDTPNYRYNRNKMILYIDNLGYDYIPIDREINKWLWTISKGILRKFKKILYNNLTIPVEEKEYYYQLLDLNIAYKLYEIKNKTVGKEAFSFSCEIWLTNFSTRTE